MLFRHVARLTRVVPSQLIFSAVIMVAAIAGYSAIQLTQIGSASAETPTAASAKDPNVRLAEFNSDQKTEIEDIVRKYLLANPEIFLEIQAELEKRMAKAEEERLKKSIGENADFLYRRADAPMAGNADGDVTVVEFFDYNCGYCKRSYKQVASLIEKDPKVKVVFLEFPILSKGSEEAAKVALAARKQGKYWEMHGGLLQHRGRADKAAALRIAKKLGLDMERLVEDMESDVVKAEINAVSELAKKMGVNGTPHFLVGDRSIPGAPQDLLDQLKKKVAEIRKDGCSVC